MSDSFIVFTDRPCIVEYDQHPRYHATFQQNTVLDVLLPGRLLARFRAVFCKTKQPSMNKTLASLVMGALLFPMASFGATAAPVNSQILQLIASLTAQVQMLQAQLLAFQSGQMPSGPVNSQLSANASTSIQYVRTDPKVQRYYPTGTYDLNLTFNPGQQTAYLPLTIGTGQFDGVNYVFVGSTTVPATLKVGCSGIGTQSVVSRGVSYCSVQPNATATISVHATVGGLTTGSMALRVTDLHYLDSPTALTYKTYNLSNVETPYLPFKVCAYKPLPGELCK